jgi:16S rRNA (guanine966-N2)-methyltransferase
MRVIAGKAKHLPLQTLPGNDTRPTQDRIKETLFNMIQNDVYDCRFLDLFAGSGGIGIEALSRGAKEAVFVDDNRRACEVIRKNLAFTKLADSAQVYCRDAKSAIRQMAGRNAFDIIFIDPPYKAGVEREILECLSDSGLVTPDTLVIVEASLETDFSYLEECGYECLRRKEYKTNTHMFLCVLQR